MMPLLPTLMLVMVKITATSSPRTFSWGGGEDAREVRIADFGIARVRRETASVRNASTVESGRQETIGSYPWMSPKIMVAGRYCPSSRRRGGRPAVCGGRQPSGSVPAGVTASPWRGLAGVGRAGGGRGPGDDEGVRGGEGHRVRHFPAVRIRTGPRGRW